MKNGLITVIARHVLAMSPLFFVAVPGVAQTDAAAQDHERRLRALEQKLQMSEGRGSTAFNPELSLILQGGYINLSQDPGTYRIGGFIPTGGEVGPGARGFSLAESELIISANADTRFSGTLVAALAPDGGVEVENAFIRASGIADGLSLAFGRFFSRIGYLNEQHPHAWDFADAPLPYRAFLGGRLAEDGVQAKWVAPTELLLEVGAEAGRGRGFPADGGQHNGLGLATVFAHLGGDLGENHSWRVGLARVVTAPRERAYDDVNGAGLPVTNAFSGRSRLWIADAVWKWTPDGSVAGRYLKLQAEVFRSAEIGTLIHDTAGAALEGDYAARQRGGYLLAVAQFMPRWRFGLRLDRLSSGSVTLGGALVPSDLPALDPHRATLRTAMLDWSPSEFSRFRIQTALDRSRPDVADRQIFVQYIVSLGAHGAHQW